MKPKISTYDINDVDGRNIIWLFPKTEYVMILDITL